MPSRTLNDSITRPTRCALLALAATAAACDDPGAGSTCVEGGDEVEAAQPAAAPAGFSHGTASVNGVEIHYVRGGEGPPLLLIHGWPETWYEWHRILPDLGKQFTVIAPDLRGAGESSKPADGYDKHTMATDLHALVAELGFADEPIAVAGHDIGMMVAYAYAVDHAEEVRRLVLMDAPLPGIEPVWSTVLLDPRSWHFDFHADTDLAVKVVAGQERTYLTAFYDKFAAAPGAFDAEEIDEAVRAYQTEGALAAGFKWYATFPVDAEANVASSAVKLKMPVLAVGGEASSGPFIGALAEAVADDVEVAVIAGSGHWLAAEQPGALTSALLDFLTAP